MSQINRIIDVGKIDEISLYLSTSDDRQRVYKAIYSAGNKPKTAKQIATATGLSEMRVSQLATPMRNHQYVDGGKENGRNFYLKFADLIPKRDQILRQAKNPRRLKEIKSQKSGHIKVTVKLARPGSEIRVDHVTIDDVDNFSRVKKLRFVKPLEPRQLKEKTFKYGLARILNESGKFQDWGGEKNDLYSTNLFINGKRLKSAIALKGVATKPPLTIKKPGKNADQIPRLFGSAAEVFFVQFEGQIQEEIIEQMETYAIKKSKETGKLIRYGIIAIEDSARLRMAYPKSFENADAD